MIAVTTVALWDLQDADNITHYHCRSRSGQEEEAEPCTGSNVKNLLVRIRFLFSHGYLDEEWRLRKPTFPQMRFTMYQGSLMCKLYLR